MPRLSTEAKAARQQQIARAALACIARDGIARTSMAAIIQESGSSAGSVYSHFESKTEIIRYAADLVLTANASLAGELASEGTITPHRLARHIFDEVLPEGFAPTALQLWAELASDPELSDVAADSLRQAFALHRETLLPWARSQSDSDATAHELATDNADAVVGAIHAFGVRTGIDPTVDHQRLARVLIAGLPH